MLPKNTKANSAQRINALANTRMQTASAEIDQLMSENEDLHMDIADIHSSMLLLKMQLKALEVQAAPYVDSKAGKSMRDDIERWKLEWRDVNLRLQQRRHVYRRGSSSATSSSILDELGNGMSSSSMHTSLSITRPGLMWGLDSDPFVIPEPLPDIETQEAEANEHPEPKPNGVPVTNPVEKTTSEPKDEPAPETKDEPAPETKDEPAPETKDEPAPETKDEPASEPDGEPTTESNGDLVTEMNGEPEAKLNGKIEGEVIEDQKEFQAHIYDEAESADRATAQEEEEEEEEESELESPPPEKTAWQELWDSITEFAGIMDYEDE
jgi:hypothetical protein